MELEDIRVQVGWVYVGPWWGQKAETLKKCWFFKLFLKDQRRSLDENYSYRTNDRYMDLYRGEDLGGVYRE